MKKKILWILGISFIVLIGSLWIIELKDKHSFERAKTEAFATEALFEQVNTTYDVLSSYKGDEIPEKEKELGLQSLSTVDTLYLTTFGSVDAMKENYSVKEAFDSIRAIENILSKDRITPKDYDTMLSYLSQIEEAVEMTDKKLNTLEKKINNYWWK